MNCAKEKTGAGGWAAVAVTIGMDVNGGAAAGAGRDLKPSGWVRLEWGYSLALPSLGG